ncbi:MAG: Gfo/Idh/MocA family oxidoreductase [Thermomicrobiales bacterium]
MIRLAMLGVNTSHADAFATIFNGTPDSPTVIDEASIVAIWGDDQTRVDDLMTRHRIPTQIADPDDAIGSVDGVLVVDDTGGGAVHADLARPYLEAGIPAFVDKPMTTNYADAVNLFAIAERTGTPLLSCSSLRFAVELEAARAELVKIGPLSSVVSVGPGDWYYYGVHAVELLGAVVGTGATSVFRHAYAERDVAVIPYENGPIAAVETLRDASYVFELTAYGANGHCSFTVDDANGFYTNTMRQVVRMIETKQSPLSTAQTLEVLGILQAGVRSGETHAEVALADIAGA